MANNYLQFAIGFHFWGSDAQKMKMGQWLHQRLTCLPSSNSRFEDIIKDHDVDIYDIEEYDTKEKDCRADIRWPFSWMIEAEGVLNWFPGCTEIPQGMYIYTEESGDIECLAAVLQIFLNEFDETKKHCIEMSWASTCSRMRIGEFSGGYVVVSADDVYWFGHQQAQDYITVAQLKEI